MGSSLSAEKRALLRQCQSVKPACEKLARAIHELSELPLREHRSTELIQQALVGNGFSIEQEFPLIPNAFVASFGSGRPVIGFLAEYDALPDCGRDGKSPGHGCGHNLLGSGSTFAAIALSKQMAKSGIGGTVKLFGCPAEETLVGKVYMARDGAFNGLDACLAWHPGGKTNVHNGSGTAMDSVSYEFFGKTAHAAGDPHNGRSALDAVEIMNVAVNFLREHVPSNVRIHYAVTDGGKAPNVVPPYARSWYYVRGADRAQVADVVRRVDRCAKGAAMATETRLKRTLLTAAYDRVGNDALASALDANLRSVGGPRFSKGDRDFVKRLGIDGTLSGKVHEVSTYRGGGSSDEANVSCLAPLSVLIVTCWAQGTPGHNRLVHRQADASAAMKGLRVAVKALALTAFDLMTDADFLDRVRREFRKATRGKTYDPLVPPDQPAPIADVPEQRSGRL